MSESLYLFYKYVLRHADTTNKLRLKYENEVRKYESV